MFGHIFAIVYWIFFPAWPFGDSYTKGAFNTITYTTKDGQVVESHWNTRALLQKEMEEARAEQATYLQEVSQASYEEIAKDVNKSAFANSMAKVIFAENCAACHQAGGAGLIGKYPNLADDAWLWGGSYQEIEWRRKLRDMKEGVNLTQYSKIINFKF